PVWLAASRRDVVDSGTTSHNTPVPTRKPLATVIGFAVPPVIGGVGRQRRRVAQLYVRLVVPIRFRHWSMTT
ncbi:MAG TPA: hypothetical protein VGL05_17535, partial [Kribbella sp.]